MNPQINDATLLAQFAERFNLKISRERGLDGKLLEDASPIIEGKRGQLYFDGGRLGLIVADGKPVIRSRWAALGGKLWMGDISPDKNGRRAQDVKITGIPLENARLAIRLVGAKRKRLVSPEQKEALRRIGFQNTHAKTHPQPPESIAEGGKAMQVNRRDGEAKSGLL